MKISRVEAFAIFIPLPVPVADAVRTITHRDHLVVRLDTTDGLEGVGFTLGYDASVAMDGRFDLPACSDQRRGRSYRISLEEIFRQSIQAGRRGAALQGDKRD